MQDSTPVAAQNHTLEALAKNAFIPAVINAIINSAIAWPGFKDHLGIPITIDSISSRDLAVFGKAIQVSLSVSIVCTLISYLTFKSGKPRPPYFPRVFLLTLKHVFFTFGVGTSIAIIWHVIFHTVEVGPVIATILVGVVACIASWIVAFMTTKELVK